MAYHFKYLLDIRSCYFPEKKKRDIYTQLQLCSSLVIWPKCQIPIGSATMENNIKFPQKIKNRTIIRSSNPTSGYLFNENEITILKS